MKTSVTYETRNLSDIDFPVYFSLSPEPGYDSEKLREYGFHGYDVWLFNGNRKTIDNKTLMKWSHGNTSIEGFYITKLQK